MAGSLERGKLRRWPFKGGTLITESSPEPWQETGQLGCREQRGGGSVRAFPASGRVSLGSAVAKRAEAWEAGPVRGP